MGSFRFLLEMKLSAFSERAYFSATAFLACINLSLFVSGCSQGAFQVNVQKKSVSQTASSSSGSEESAAPITPITPGADEDAMPDEEEFVWPCSNGSKFAETFQFASGEVSGIVGKTNVIFILDTSGSMDNEILALNQRLPEFMMKLNQSLGNESNRVVLDAVFNQTRDAHKMFQIPAGIYHHSRGSERGGVDSRDKLLRIRNGLGFGSAAYKIPEDQLITQPGASFNHVIITDDIEAAPGCVSYPRPSTTACALDYHQRTADQMTQRGWSHRLHALHIRPDSVLSTACTPGIQGAVSGAPYLDLTTQFRGRSYNLCSPAWDELFDGLVKTIVESSSSSALKSCSSSPLRITKATLIQGTKRVDLNVATEVALVQATSTKLASFQLAQGVLTKYGLKTQDPYSLEVHYEVSGGI